MPSEVVELKVVLANALPLDKSSLDRFERGKCLGNEALFNVVFSDVLGDLVLIRLMLFLVLLLVKLILRVLLAVMAQVKVFSRLDAWPEP